MNNDGSVPYTAYKSKRHSRTISNPHLVPNMSPPPVRTSRPSSVIGTFTPALITQDAANYLEKEPLEGFGDWRNANGKAERNGNGSASASESGTTSPLYSGPPSPLASSGRTSATLPPLQLNSDEGSDKEETSNGTPNVAHDPPKPAMEPNHRTSSSKDLTPRPSVISPRTSMAISVNGLPFPQSSSTLHPASPPQTAGRTLSPASSSSSTQSSPPQAPPVSRRTSTFRRVPLRSNARSPLPSSPLRPGPPSSLGSPSPSESRSLAPNSPSIRAFDLSPYQPAHRTLELHSPTLSQRGKQKEVERRPSGFPLESVGRQTSYFGVVTPPTPHPPPTNNSKSTTRHISSFHFCFRIHHLEYRWDADNAYATRSTDTPCSAPYRPGFQPKGVYRNRTDELAALRRAKKDEGRVERDRLERRWDKLVALHFPLDGASTNAGVESKSGSGSNGARGAAKGGAGTNGASQPSQKPTLSRRASSLFDFDFQDLKDPGGLLKGVLARGMSDGMMRGKSETRVQEQRITPWQEDASVSKCPLCSIAFHPLTNRKHHCRLCGQIICSLPIKHPQRPALCSLLFIIDSKTRAVEEVGEGVDYGVRRRRDSVSSLDGGGKGKGPGAQVEDDDKFMKGVRICRECRPVLRKQQFYQELTHAPTFARFHEAFVTLEKEIEDALPQFQELILSLNQDAPPTKEASAARKRLLEAFAQYDALSKRIRSLPNSSGPGSSQDRVQTAVLTRANIFLQKNMFPLQSLPTPKTKKSSASSAGGGIVGDSSSSSGSPHQVEAALDPDSATAHALQPLLEQEALLETFVEEAKAHRKFEDVKTLKANLKEIRGEIDRVMSSSGGLLG